jgi:hypothetical protein
MADNTKFLGFTLDNSLSWKTHIDTIAPKLSSACFALRVVKPLLSWDLLKMVYFLYFHSIMTYGIIFWGPPVVVSSSDFKKELLELLQE